MVDFLFADIVDDLRSKKLIYKKLAPIDLTVLGIKKNIYAFRGVDLNGYYHLIFYIPLLGGLGGKDIEFYDDLHYRLVKYFDHAFKKKFIFARKIPSKKNISFFDQKGWKVFIASL